MWWLPTQTGGTALALAFKATLQPPQVARSKVSFLLRPTKRFLILRGHFAATNRPLSQHSHQRKARWGHGSHHKPTVPEHRHGPGPALSTASVSLRPLKCGGKCDNSASPPPHPGDRGRRLQARWTWRQAWPQRQAWPGLAAAALAVASNRAPLRDTPSETRTRQAVDRAG